MIELLNCDCMEYMKGLPDKAFDLAIVDPPYGTKIGGETNGRLGNHKPFGQRGFEKAGKNKIVNAKVYRVFDDTKPPDESYFKELFRVSKNQIIWGANHFISKIPYDSSCWIVWDKDNSGNYADCELAWTSFQTAVRQFTFRWNGLLQQDMKNKEERIHPTQKPRRLYKWLMDKYAKEGNKILDTHLGSGSSAIAAHQMGFDFVGCEIDAEYHAAAVKRFYEQTKQISMFPNGKAI